MNKIAPYPVEYYIKELRDNARNIDYAKIEGLLTWSAKYLEYQNNLINKYENDKQKLNIINEKIDNIENKIEQLFLHE